MSRIFKDRLSMGVTPVADTFIDTYMAAANGEYVKVYLYILRHQNKEDLSLEQIADALNHTEADVKRAINYWQKAGVLEQVQESPAESILIEQNHTNWSMDIEVTPAASKETAAAQVQSPAYSAEQVSRLNNDEEFSQLLYIAQKFLNKAFTPRDCQVFAYLYDTLGMNIGLLEYLAEYCAQNGHTSNSASVKRFGRLFKARGEHAAGAAPGRPEVNKNGSVAVDGLIKSFVVDVKNFTHDGLHEVRRHRSAEEL